MLPASSVFEPKNYFSNLLDDVCQSYRAQNPKPPFLPNRYLRRQSLFLPSVHALKFYQRIRIYQECSVCEIGYAKSFLNFWIVVSAVEFYQVIVSQFCFQSDYPVCHPGVVNRKSFEATVLLSVRAYGSLFVFDWLWSVGFAAGAK